MASGLRARLAAEGAPAPAAPAPPPPAVVEVTTPPSATDPSVVDEVLELISNIDVEAVVGGALMRISFGAGTNPADVAQMLRLLDPNAKVRDAIPSKSFGGGNRDTKTARCVNILLRITASGKFIDLVCQNGEDVVVGVSKKAAETFVDNLKALNKLHEANIARVQKAFGNPSNTPTTIILAADEIFGVKYWTTDDGKAFLEEMTAEAPASQEGGPHV